MNPYKDLEYLCTLAIEAGGAVFRARGLYNVHTGNAGKVFISRFRKWKKKLLSENDHRFDAIEAERGCKCGARACGSPDACTGFIINLTLTPTLGGIQPGDLTDLDGVQLTLDLPTPVVDLTPTKPDLPEIELDIDFTAALEKLKGKLK